MTPPEHPDPTLGVTPDAPAEAPATGEGFGAAAGQATSETEVEAPAPQGSAGQGSTVTADEDPMLSLARELEERTADLQRLQAEYLNYKRRVDRDRGVLAENIKFQSLAPFLDVLDTIDRAKEHGELEPGFKAVADQLVNVVEGQGLVRFADPGDPFDPNLHDALSHLGTDAEVDVQTVKVVAKSGYKLGDRVLRPAQVLVVDPE